MGGFKTTEREYTRRDENRPASGLCHWRNDGDVTGSAGLHASRFTACRTIAMPGHFPGYRAVQNRPVSPGGSLLQFVKMPPLRS